MATVLKLPYSRKHELYDKVAHMKIVVATALYPPDIAQPAPYIKELARHLSLQHNVTVVTYGRLPEQVPGVSFIPVDKRSPAIVRIPRFIYTLWNAMHDADVLFAENSPSVELPVALLSFFIRAKIILHAGDMQAQTKAQHSALFGMLERFAQRCADVVVTDTPNSRPEILPFTETLESEIDAHERAWNAHIQKLEQLFI